MRGRVLAPPGRESPSQQVFGLGINQAGAPSQPTWGQWPLLRLSPLPLRVSSGFAPDSLTQPRWVRLAQADHTSAGGTGAVGVSAVMWRMRFGVVNFSLTRQGKLTAPGERCQGREHRTGCRSAKVRPDRQNRWEGGLCAPSRRRPHSLRAEGDKCRVDAALAQSRSRSHKKSTRRRAYPSGRARTG